MKKVFAILMVSLTAGCAYNPAPPTADSYDSIVDTAKHFYESSEAGWISVSRMHAEIKEDNYSRFFREGYCLKDDFKTSDFTKIAQKKCHLNGGTMVGSWCASLDTEQPLFFARAGSPGSIGAKAGCNGHFQKAGILAMEPRFKGDPAWLTLAQKWDYKSPSEAAEEERLEAEEQRKLREEVRKTHEKAVRMEKLRREQDADYMLNNIGTFICQINNRVRYKGQVDDMRDGKIRVHILQAYSLRTRSVIRNFDPLYIWADPHAWELC